jgi:hypothetical protein
MAFASRSQTAGAPKRAAVYLRVSTGRQAAGDVSIPSQRDLTRAHCEGQGWVVVAEFVEPGASATDDRRPAFQRMLEQARSPDRPFDVICAHAFSRFYRNGAEMELTIRQLRKSGVEVVSVTQPTGDDPSQQLMRQMIGITPPNGSTRMGTAPAAAPRLALGLCIASSQTPAMRRVNGPTGFATRRRAPFTIRLLSLRSRSRRSFRSSFSCGSGRGSLRTILALGRPAWSTARTC